MVRKHEEKYEKIILYLETGAVTGKAHLQGWIKFRDMEVMRTFVNNVVGYFRKKHELKPSDASCAVIKKDTYFAYTAKDKNCVYSVGVSEDERVANEEASYQKQVGKKGDLVDK